MTPSAGLEFSAELHAVGHVTGLADIDKSEVLVESLGAVVGRRHTELHGFDAGPAQCVELGLDHATPPASGLGLGQDVDVKVGGWGRRLIETELDALRRAGVKGVQLGVSPTNPRASGFYEHLGFVDISLPGFVTYGMALR